MYVGRVGLAPKGASKFFLVVLVVYLLYRWIRAGSRRSPIPDPKAQEFFCLFARTPSFVSQARLGLLAKNLSVKQRIEEFSKQELKSTTKTISKTFRTN